MGILHQLLYFPRAASLQMIYDYIIFQGTMYHSFGAYRFALMSSDWVHQVLLRIVLRIIIVGIANAIIEAHVWWKITLVLLFRIFALPAMLLAK